MRSTATISVIIPVLNEAAYVEQAVRAASEIADEVIVVDGGSVDATPSMVSDLDCRLVSSTKGRGQQLSKGAAEASGEILLFLHADTLLPPSAKTQIMEAWGRCDGKQQETFYGCFRQQILSYHWLFRLIESGNYLRAKHQKLPYGDQGVFVSRTLYDRVDGIPEISLMEDFEFSRKLSRVAVPKILRGPILVDARRWEKSGPIRQTWRNWTIATRYRMGVDPEVLRSKY